MFSSLCVDRKLEEACATDAVNREFALPPRTPTIPESSEIPSADPIKPSGGEREQKITPFEVEGGVDAEGKSTGM